MINYVEPVYNSLKEEVPIEIAKLALERKNNDLAFFKKYAKNGNKINDMFNWKETTEGHGFWYEVNAGKYNRFYKKYPKKEIIIDNFSII